jgi:hypothetical protein
MTMASNEDDLEPRAEIGITVALKQGAKERHIK